MEESSGDSIEPKNELSVAFQTDKKIWLGGVLDCFASVVAILGGPNLKREPEEPWEIPFELIHELSYLGAGAQGVVFGGRLNGEMVAVKKVREKAEINVKHLRKLNHENIVRFKGICTMPPFYCVVMEFCQYGSLFEFLHSGSNLLPGQLMRWARDVALGMAYLHQHNIIHRDLKSPNVLIADNLTVKVSDFGTSREWENVSTIMSFTGTVAWMAPEVIRHEPCSEKIDVWSFGVVLWEILTREIPYKHLETHAIMWGVGTDTLALPIPSGCPNSVQVLMCQCWQRIPKNRPPFKIIAAHLEMATADIAAVDVETFAARQASWGAEAREGMERIYARNAPASGSGTSTPAAVEAPLKPREDLRQVKEVYEQQIVRANELFMEVCTVRLQLEQRERAIAEREKLLKACRCGQRKSFKIQRQQSSTSSDGKPVLDKQPRKKKPQAEAQLVVNYVEKEKHRVHSVAVHDCASDDEEMCIRNNNVESKKETRVEKNGNVEFQMVPVHKPKHVIDNVVPDVAQV